MTQPAGGFTPDAPQIRLAESVFLAMAHEARVRDIVEAYQTKILADNRWTVDPKWIALGLPLRPDQVVTEARDIAYLREEDCDRYLALCAEAAAAARLTVSRPGNCPLLEAESLRRDAERALLGSMATLPGLASLANGPLLLDLHVRAVDLVLGLLSPYVSDAGAILARHAKMPAIPEQRRTG